MWTNVYDSATWMGVLLPIIHYRMSAFIIIIKTNTKHFSLAIVSFRVENSKILPTPNYVEQLMIGKLVSNLA